MSDCKRGSCAAAWLLGLWEQNCSFPITNTNRFASAKRVSLQEQDESMLRINTGRYVYQNRSVYARKTVQSVKRVRSECKSSTACRLVGNWSVCERKRARLAEAREISVQPQDGSMYSSKVG